MGRFFFFLLLMYCMESQLHASRYIENFNREWKYMRGDCKGAERLDYEDCNWEWVGLPHSFSIPYFMSKDFYTGYGWYRKSFDVCKEDLSRRLFLEFDGVFQEAEIFVNGCKAGHHVGGYTGFSVDISELVNAGSNIVAVRVNNLWKPDVAPRAGEHVFSGGIYRNVRLVMKSPVYIDWYGTFVTTPNLGENQGESSVVRTETEICNSSDEEGIYKLLTQILDVNGKVLAVSSTESVLPARSHKTFVQTSAEIKSFQLWSPKTPTLYKVVSKLYESEQLIDEEETFFGFRWFEWTADCGFFLNGKHFYFRGVNVHQDQAGWGDAVTESAMRRDVGMMKEAGFDLIRGSHYPHAPAFVQACDELGMLFWSEAPFWGIGGFKSDGYWNSSAYPINEADEAGFEKSALQQLEEMIRIHRNHPSIVVWSMCNEAFFSAPEAMPGVRRLLKRMVERTRQLDPTRPTAVGGAQRPLGENRIDKLGDIAGYNGDGATQLDFQNPGIPNAVSEYGSTTSERPGEYMPGWGDLSKNNGWKGYPWRSGHAIWCGFDHGSIAGSVLGKMGIVDYFRIPKRSWYWYRNEYRQIPPPKWPIEGVPVRLGLYATKTDGVLADGTDDVSLTVHVLDADGRVLSNTPSVRLNLISGPGEFPTGNSILFEKDSDIRMMDGQASIAFRSYYAGTAVLEATSPGLLPARITIDFVGAPKHQPEKCIRQERPYSRFVKKSKETSVQVFGQNNPAFASSRQGQQSAGLAADGDKNTFWQAADNDNAPWWMLDTEKGLVLHRVRVSFPKEAVYNYRIEASVDNKEWTVLVDNTNKVEAILDFEEEFDVSENSVKARFIRISFAGNSHAAITDVEVSGEICE